MSSLTDFLTKARDFTLETAYAVADVKRTYAEIEMMEDGIQPMPDGTYYYSSPDTSPVSYEPTGGASGSWGGSAGLSNNAMIALGIGGLALVLIATTK